MTAATLDWEAATYDRVSGPQQQLAREVLERLTLRGDETILDAGCGTGQVTKLLVQRVPRGCVIAVDASRSMVALARTNLDGRVDVREANLVELELAEAVDVVFSTAVFHHIADHERLFARLRGTLRDGGRLVAQCGGEGNLTRFRALADVVARRSPYAEQLSTMPLPWNYASPQRTEERLRAAGFTEIRCWLEPRPVQPQDPHAFLRTVVLNYHVECLGPDLGGAYVHDVLAALDGPPTLDYVRLNIEARAA